MPTQSVTMTKAAPEALRATAPQPGAGGSDFAQLSRRMAAEGLLDRRPGYYTVRAGLVLAAYLGGFCALFVPTPALGRAARITTWRTAGRGWGRRPGRRVRSR
ncbi:hypothetical protein ACFV1W_00465 [Kitasatospora sp. NPDC059648]|uniref:hypothetical protein n=1 Tax=Kitasatospora sp. NPDC059648 TaxID=3346894 RepID=UPI0036827070